MIMPFTSAAILAPHAPTASMHGIPVFHVKHLSPMLAISPIDAEASEQAQSCAVAWLLGFQSGT